MRKKIFYGAMFGIFTLVLFVAASFYLEQNLNAAPGDWCECNCWDDALDNCEYGCRYHRGCVAAVMMSSRCDSSSTTCNNIYGLLCEDGKKPLFVCSEPCSSCDKSFWE